MFVIIAVLWEFMLNRNFKLFISYYNFNFKFNLEIRMERAA